MASLLRKALEGLYPSRGKGSRGSLSSFAMNAPRNYGQPLPGQTQDLFGFTISPERMRELALKSPTLSACVNAILDYAVNVPMRIRNVDPTQRADPDRVRFVQQFLAKPNKNDTWRHYLDKTLRDAIVLGGAATEIEWNTQGKPFAIHPLDSARLRIDFDENAEIEGYNMIDIHGQPVKGPDGIHAWEPKDIIYYRRDVASDSQYAVSRVKQLFTLGVVENLMLHFIGQRFTDSNIPYGVMDLGDISDQELERAKEMWVDQAASPHEILLTGSKGGSKWFPFSYNMSELEATNLIQQIQGKIMAIISVTENEFGSSADINKSNGYNLSFTFKKRAIEPLLNELYQTLTTRLLWDAFGFTDLELYYEEIDARDDLLMAQIDEIYLRNATLTFNQVRNRRGDPSVQGGDEPYVQTGQGWIPLRLVGAFAEAQLAGVWAMVQATQMQAAAGPDGGGASPNISSGLVRPPQLPMKFGTPDAAGNSAPKFSYSKPQANKTAKGPVEQMRQVGHRTEQNKG